MKILSLLLGLSLALTVHAAEPLANTVDGVRNYQIYSPMLATGGEVTADALAQLKSLGYEQVIDLRTPEEHSYDEAAAARQLGLRYTNLPTGGSLPDDQQIQTFGELVQQGKTLVHCRSGNRVGMTWALWQLSQGVPLEQAITEGKAMGMKADFEQAIRARADADGQ